MFSGSPAAEELPRLGALAHGGEVFVVLMSLHTCIWFSESPLHSDHAYECGLWFANRISRVLKQYFCLRLSFEVTKDGTQAVAEVTRQRSAVQPCRQQLCLGSRQLTFLRDTRFHLAIACGAKHSHMHESFLPCLIDTSPPPNQRSPAADFSSPSIPPTSLRTRRAQ